MIDLKSIPTSKKDLDSYEVDHLFHSWSYQPAQAPLRVLTARVSASRPRRQERLDSAPAREPQHRPSGPPGGGGHLRAGEDALRLRPQLLDEPRAVLARCWRRSPGDLSAPFSPRGHGGQRGCRQDLSPVHRKAEDLSRYRTYHGGTAASMTLSVATPGAGQVSGGPRWCRCPSLLLRCMSTEVPECDLACVK